MKIENMLQRFSCISFSFKPPCAKSLKLHSTNFLQYTKAFLQYMRALTKVENELKRPETI